MALFRKLMNSGDTAVAEDLDVQIARAQDVRGALEALVTIAQAHIDQMPRVNASLEENDRRATDISQRLESLAARVDDLENIGRQTQAAESRVVVLEERVQQALAREAQVEQHRSTLEQVVALSKGAIESLEGLKQERIAFQELEDRLPRLRKEFQPLFDQHTGLKSDLDQLRTGIATLAQDAETGR